MSLTDSFGLPVFWFKSFQVDEWRIKLFDLAHVNLHPANSSPGNYNQQLNPQLLQSYRYHF